MNKFMETKPEKQPFGSNKHIYVLDAEKSNLTSTSYVPQPQIKSSDPSVTPNHCIVLPPYRI
jgi:hypothetical protein